MSGMKGCSNQSSPQDSLNMRSAAASSCCASCSGLPADAFAAVASMIKACGAELARSAGAAGAAFALSRNGCDAACDVAPEGC